MAAPKGNQYALGNNGGRPTIYSQELADVICDRIATSSLSLKKLCDNDEFMPYSGTVLRWLREKEDFRNQYARAKEEQADYLAEQILDIADDSSNDTVMGEFGPMEHKEWINRSRLRVDARKWIASKLKPKKYGDKLELGGGLENKGMSDETLQAIADKINGNSK